jgi:SnoaL-like domain
MAEITLGSKAEIVKRFLTETRSAEQFASYFTSDAFYRVGNNEPLIGRDRIQESSVKFRQMLKGISHDIQHIWELGDTVVCEMVVTYTRNDDKVVTLPCMDVIHLEGDKFREIQIFIDMSPVFAH